LSEKYTVQTPNEAIAYLNIFFFKKRYTEILHALQSRTAEAVEKVAQLYRDRTGRSPKIEFITFKGEKVDWWEDPRKEAVNHIRTIYNSTSHPLVVLFALPPYYPAPLPLKNEEIEEKFREVVQGAGYDPVVLNYYPYISDLSFFAPPSAYEDFLNLSPVRLDTSFATEFFSEVPLYNAGPFGKDAHKKFERVEKKYSLEVLPEFLKKIVEGGDG
jgi:arginine utilization protein RocB